MVPYAAELLYLEATDFATGENLRLALTHFSAKIIKASPVHHEESGGELFSRGPCLQNRTQYPR